MVAAARQFVFHVGFPLVGLMLLSSSAAAEQGDAARVLPNAVADMAAMSSSTDSDEPSSGSATVHHGNPSRVPLPRPRLADKEEEGVDAAEPVLALVPLPPIRPATLRDTLPAEPAPAESTDATPATELPAFVGVDKGGLRSLVARHAARNGVPAALADAVVTVESRYNPRARNGANIGLMQISLPTARSLGYAGPAAGLTDADTNLTYGVRYLAQAYRLADGDTCRTILKFQGGHRAATMTTAARSYCTQVQAHAARLR